AWQSRPRSTERPPVPIPSTAPIPQRRLLRDDVYRSIRDAIVRGQLAPGEQLRDQELGAWLQVSRTPVREALQRLAQAGLVGAEPGRMTRVAPENPGAVVAARQIAAQLHALAMRLALPKLDENDASEMEAANDWLQTALSDSDIDAAIAADDAFHQVALSRSGNALIPDHLEVVTATLRRAEYLHFDSVKGRASPEQHGQIITAVRAGDPDRAVSLTWENWSALTDVGVDDGDV
ncbi:MAG: GntR family transcriptional regulator, partial [Brevibacterium sp.]|nr:GntR family transcriptional regulator [Brevibacterium sp.]